MHKAQKQVIQFMNHVGQTIPNDISFEANELRVSLIHEEAEEFGEACLANNLVAMLDALCDLLYVTYGAACALGIDLQPFFDEVHKSNMTKDGSILRDDGKILKGKGFKLPDLQGILDGGYGKIKS